VGLRPRARSRGRDRAPCPARDDRASRGPTRATARARRVRRHRCGPGDPHRGRLLPGPEHRRRVLPDHFALAK
jgi:hypothetical protein